MRNFQSNFSLYLVFSLQLSESKRVCHICPETQYSLSSKCEKCPDNVICSGGRASIIFGYYAFVDNDKGTLSKGYLCPSGYCCQKQECVIGEDNLCAPGW